MNKERFIVEEMSNWGLEWRVWDTALDRFICYSKTKADAVTICEALNKQDEKIQQEFKLKQEGA